MAEGRTGGKVKKIALWSVALCIIAGIAVFLVIALGGLRWWQSERDLTKGETALRFTEVALPFENRADLKHSLPFMGSAVIDVTGDGVDEVFLGGGKGQDDQVFALVDGAFVSLYTIPQSTDDATMGAVSIDLDNDGRVELLLARESGLWRVNLESGGTAVQIPLDLPLQENTVPLSIALTDLNGDGLADMYVSGYIRNDLVEGQTVFKKPYGGYSHLFVSNETGGWDDVTRAAGLWRQHNTFSAMFADIDNDGDADLVVAQDTGHVEMYLNGGDLRFTPLETPAAYSYPMGIAAGDIDGNGLIDFYFSNVGHTLPSAILRGDLEDTDVLNTNWILLINEGGGTFTDRAEAHGLAKLGFGWGAVFADMDLDGRLDMMAAQNYARFPGKELLIKYPGKLMLQDADGNFARVEDRVGIANEAYAITPLVGDFDGNGMPDVVWANLAGRSRAFLSEGPVGNSIVVQFEDNVEALGARVRVRTPDGTERVRWHLSGEGLGSDQSSQIFIGLGENESADVFIDWPGGMQAEMNNVAAGSVVEVELP